MNISLVTGEFPPMQGGVGAFTSELAKALAAHFRVHIVTHRLARPESSGQNVGALLEPVDLGYAALHPRMRSWNWRDVSLVADLALRFNHKIVNIQYQPAAYNMRNPAINLLPWRLKGLAKSVVTFHDLRVPYLFPKAGPVRRWVLHMMARHADGVIVTNRADYFALRQRIKTPLRMIPIGSNIAIAHPTAAAVAEARARLGVDHGALLLGYFGFLHESKGADTLLATLAQLPASTKLLFIGGRTGASDPDNNRAFFEKLDADIAAQGLGDRVLWTGFVETEMVSTYLNAADIMVMPYRDGASLRRGTLMAALAHGRPLVTTHPVYETPELAHGQNVWLVPAGAPEKVAAAVEMLRDNAKVRKTLARGATAVADLFTWDKIAAETGDFYDELLAS